ncbi:MAG: isopentenyl phosphate kinase family protein [Candidatus Altiarchaeota archaeon]|nr:isopentenyl phosphate kinase family protein [Candidatus Altiarchaeota archaeon]
MGRVITILKLGGSVITDKNKPFTVRRDAIRRLVVEIKDAMAKNPGLRLIVGNGGGSFPHMPAEEGKLKDGIVADWQYEFLAKTQLAAKKLNMVLQEEFLAQGIPSFSLQPSSLGITIEDRVAKIATAQIEELLKSRVIPLVYGDVFIDTKKGCSIVSTETLILELAKEMKIDRVIVGTNVDGVLGRKEKAVKEVTPSNISKLDKFMGGSGSTDVTGGMKHKVETMMVVARFVPEVRIVNALKPGYINRTLLGEPLGTRIVYND